MRLSDVFKEDHILADIKSTGKREVLDEIASAVHAMTNGLDRAELLNALIERERLGTTGIGHGVAIPHGKIKGMTEIKVFFGRSRSGVDFNSMDGLPVHLIFLIIAPEHSAASQLKVLSSISRLLKNQDTRLKLMREESPAELYRTIVDADLRSSAFYGQ